MKIYDLSPRAVRYIMYCWPPLLFTGIRISHISDDFRSMRVRMPLRFYNKNAVGIQFGGSLFTMVDPCHMFMLARSLGPAYKVLDQGACIDFIQPGAGTVVADCVISEADLEDIYARTKNGDKTIKEFVVDITDVSGEVIARVTKRVYIRKKRSR